MYHYTDIGAVANIVEHNELWLTNAEYLNDHTEGEELYLMMSEIFEDEPNIIKLLDFVNLTTETYCLSFSLEKDLLSQWRGYCPSFGGYNLGFSNNLFQLPLKIIDGNDKECKYPSHNEHIESIVSGELLNFSMANDNCIYLKKEKVKYAQHLAGILQKAYLALNQRDLPVIKKFFDSGFSSLNAVDIIDITLALNSNSGWFGNYGNGKYKFKNSAFAEESEQRFFIISKKGHAKPFYRMKNNVLIPYLKLRFDEALLRSITIGPCANKEFAHQGLIHFLAHNSKRTDENINSILKFSDIPFRTI